MSDEISLQLALNTKNNPGQLCTPGNFDKHQCQICTFMTMLNKLASSTYTLNCSGWCTQYIVSPNGLK